MNLTKSIHRLLAIILILLGILEGSDAVSAKEAARVISGTITDMTTDEPLSFVTVEMQKGRTVVYSNNKGSYSIYNTFPTDTLLITCVGYKPVKKSVKEISGNRYNVELIPKEYALNELIVKPHKEKYTKKNNPAVELMERIRATRNQNDPREEPYYGYDRYEKLTISINDFKAEEHKDGSKTGKFGFVNEYIDTAQLTGKPILHLAVREKMSRMLHRHHDPKSDKEVVTGLRSNGVDEMFNQGNVQKVMEDVFRDIDIYQNDITLLQNRFVSPLSRIGADYYKYFIMDTITDPDGTRLIELEFVPRNPESFSFNGKLFVEVGDTSYFIRRVRLQVPKVTNVNFVKSLIVDQEFIKDSLGNRHKVVDDMAIVFYVIPSAPELYVRRLATSENFSYEKDDYLKQFYDLDGRQYTLKEALKRDDRFWTEGFHPVLTGKEARMAEFMRRMREVPLYYYGEKALKVISYGYFRLGKPPVFDLGPINTMVSYNDVEGIRLRLGGNTTAQLSPHWFSRFYGAYGTKDHRWKYKGELEYSIAKKENHSREFPMHAIRLTHQYNLDEVGQKYPYTNRDNIFLSLKTTDNYKMTYRRHTDLEYILERRSGFSLVAGLKHEIQYPTRWLPFVDGHGVTSPHFSLSAFHVTLRYAPNETFVQDQSIRLPINMDSWVFQLSHEYGPKGMLGAGFTLNKTEASIGKRFWFSSFGYLDSYLKGGKVWSQVPFTALPWPNANISYTIQPESFALMNPMEFAADQYVSWDLTYWMNGLIFNRIPMLSKLKLREALSFRGYYGSLSAKNDPQKNPDIYRFPTDAGVTTLGKTPYMELGVGLDNVLKVLRIDYVWRLTYRDVPGTHKSGVRIALHLSF